MPQCRKCGNDATCTIGTVDHCADCAHALLEPLRQKHGVITIARTTERDGLRTCGTCGATWIGSDYECIWCERRAERMESEKRERLLFPSWADERNYGPKYDELDEVDKRIWRKTRGVFNSEDSQTVWINHLTDAVVDGTITVSEMRQALERVGHIARRD